MSSHFHLIIRIENTRKVTISEVKEAYKNIYGHDLHSNCLTIRSLVTDAYNLSKLMQRFLHDGSDSSKFMKNLCDAYNESLDPDGKKLSIEEFTEMLNKILSDGCKEIAKERASQRKTGIKGKNIVIWAEESYIWNHAGAVGPQEKLGVFMTKIREFDQTILSWVY